jgi:hypothetical protein
MNPLNKFNEQLMKEKSTNSHIKGENTKLKTNNEKLDKTITSITKEKQKLTEDNLIYYNSVSDFCNACPIKGNIECETCSLNNLVLTFDLWKKEVKSKKK